MKGTNCVYITSDAIIDYPLSLCKYIISHSNMDKEYEENVFSKYINKPKLFDMNLFKFKRCYGFEHIASMIMSEENHKFCRELVEGLVFKGYLTEALFDDDYKYIVLTDTTKRLIRGSSILGEGKLISNTVRPMIGTVQEKEFLKSTFKNITIDDRPPEEVDTDSYGRFIFGDYREAIKYKYNCPRSIVLMNYRENMDPNNIERLHPEVVVELGDIHNLLVMEAYDIKKEN